MVIGGIIIKVHPDERKDVMIILKQFSTLAIYGSDEKGNIIATITSTNARSMNETIKEINNLNQVLEVNLAYLNTER